MWNLKNKMEPIIRLQHLAIALSTLWHFAFSSFVSTFQRSSASNVNVEVAVGECVAMLLHDGFSQTCARDTNQLVGFGSVMAHYDEFSLILFRENTGKIIDAMQLRVTPLVTNPSSPQLNCSTPPRVRHTWPSPNEVITDSSFDLQFHLSVPCCDAGLTFRTCIQLQGLAHGPNRATIETRSCTETEKDVLLHFSQIPSGSYVANFFALSAPADWPQDRVLEHFRRYSLEALNREVVPIAQLPFVIATDLSALSLASAPSSPSALRQKIADHRVWVGGSSSESLAVTVLLGRNWSFDETEEDPIHLSFITSRSLDRYLEAETMLKSLLYNSLRTNKSRRRIVMHVVADTLGKQYFQELWENEKSGLGRLGDVAVALHDFDKVCGEPVERFWLQTEMNASFHHSGKAGYCRLFLAEYFQSIASMQLTSKAEVVEGDLRSLQSLKIFPSQLIALETDQIVLGDIFELWKEFDHFDDDDIVAAAENYQPWQDSRPKVKPGSVCGNGNGTNVVDATETESDESEQSASPVGEEVFLPVIETAPSESKEGVLAPSKIRHDGTYHGYGVIGGVMLFHLERMNSLEPPFLQQVEQAVGHYRSVHGEWNAELNDQDIFNVYFLESGQESRLAILPCSWNVQFHARLNTIQACLPELVSPEVSIGSVRTSEVVSNMTERDPSLYYASTAEYFEKNARFIEDVPLNCEASRAQHLFACESSANILHFMARSYNGDYRFMRYYSHFWQLYRDLSWKLLV